MTFYMKPPRGFVKVNNLEDTVRQRLACYDILFSTNSNQSILDLECLSEDTAFDRLGHYLFRLVSLKSNRFLNAFVKHEVKLLDTRLSCYNSTDAKYVTRKLRKHAIECLQSIQEAGHVKNFYILLVRVLTQLLQRKFIRHAFVHHDGNCCECQHHLFKVPFDFCLDLVASREYEITNGLVHVYSFQWKHLLSSLYKTYLNIILREMRTLPKVYSTLEDERIKNVVLLTKQLFLNESLEIADSKQGTFKLNSFGQEYKKFPPCMRNLYGILQKKNRLSHNARFEFSLYLKGIGLSMNDALKFWENSYSKQHTSCSRCTHSWQDNEKRYIYGIRHLYGLEGSRKNYSVKSCQQIQEMSLSATDEGGCPFRHYDDDNLRILLKSYLPKESYDHIEVIIYERRQKSSIGCELFLTEYLNKMHQKSIKETQVKYQDPAQYYSLVKDFLLEE